jgi:hypothetical protein
MIEINRILDVCKYARRVSPALLVAGLALSGSAAFALRSAVTSSARRSDQTVLKIRGGLRAPLRPGTWQPVDLAVVNRHAHALAITRVSVRLSVDRRHRAAGCSAARDFVVRQLPANAYPVIIRRRRARMLPITPWVGMRDLADRNQDACVGAALRLRYGVTARTARVLDVRGERHR